jgi:gluconolactonase
MHSPLTLYTDEVLAFINPRFTIEKLDDNCQFAEGPVWHKEGCYLFSDIPANAVYKIVPGQPKELYIPNSGGRLREAGNLSEQVGSNGLAYDSNGNLYLCQHGGGSIAKYTAGEASVFIGGYQGKPFNSPNDIVIHSDGTVYFSDPPYGLKEQQLNKTIGQDQAAFYACREGRLVPFCNEYRYPNGLCLSPDETGLYVGSSKPFERFILEFDTATLERKRIVAAENCDGIKCDRRGNLFLCTKEGIIIMDTAGKRLAKIELETAPANCCWGGEDGNDLFITARQHLFLIRDLQTP